MNEYFIFRLLRKITEDDRLSIDDLLYVISAVWSLFHEVSDPPEE